MLLFQTAFRLVIRPILLGLLTNVWKAGVEVPEVGHVQAHGVTTQCGQGRHSILLPCDDIRVARRRMCLVLLGIVR